MVDHTQADFAGCVLDADDDHSVRLAVLGGIVEKVGQHLAHAQRIDLDHDGLRRQQQDDRKVPCLQLSATDVGSRVDEVPEVDDLLVQLRMPRGQVAGVEQVIREAGDPQYLSIDQRACRFAVRCGLVLENPYGSLDCCQRTAQLMGDGGE